MPVRLDRPLESGVSSVRVRWRRMIVPSESGGAVDCAIVSAALAATQMMASFSGAGSVDAPVLPPASPVAAAAAIDSSP
jgi:hypothetical protein